MPASPPSNRWPVALITLFALLLLFLVARQRLRPPASGMATVAAPASNPPARFDPGFRFQRLSRASGPEGAPVDAAAIVREKLTRFSEARLQLARALAASNHVALPPQAAAFFAAVGDGDWDRASALYRELDQVQPADEHEATAWHRIKQAVKETYGVAETVHEWPADRLLQYGETVLSTLRPGMVYVGGTDPGRFIPTLLNATSGSEPHVVVTQNALADASYLDYLRFQYADRLALPDPADSQRCFQEYLQDAQARALHDQQSPDEPAQLRPGENVRITENRVQVSGQVAVMAINEKLLTTLLDKNPELVFALEESFPLPSTYEGAVPGGALLELRATGSGHGLSAAQASEALDFWRGAQQDLDSEPLDSEVRKAWAKMAVAQSNLLARQGFAAEAEQGYGLARAIAPKLPEAVLGLAALMEKSGRPDEAVRLRSLLPGGP